MEENKLLSLDYLFEVSWEVCNKVGGIHTVLATKALTIQQQLGDKYVVIGPDMLREGTNPEFEEDPNLLKAWRQAVYEEGIRIRIGRWKVKGEPLAVLVDFSSFISRKDEVLSEMWENYKVDSISGQWDYIEPVLFGYAAGQVIAHYTKTFCKPGDRMVAHFHEWMTSSGGLYLRRYNDYIATVFTTHATVMGRSIAGNNLPLYRDLDKFNADELARQFNVMAKHSLEKKAAQELDCFATVSDLTANECKYLLGKEVDIVTPNGFEDDIVWQGEEFTRRRKEGRKAMFKVAEACLDKKYEKEPLVVITSGRYEFKNKGLDVFVDALLQLAGREDLDREVLAVIAVPAGNNGPRIDLQAYLRDPKNNPIDRNQLRNTTHYLTHPEWDPVIQRIQGTRLTDPACKVQLLFIPTYLNGDDGIFNMPYYELLVGADISAFPSYYEPWGYTPLESVAFSVPTVTTTLAGFGLWVDDYADSHPGVEVILRDESNDPEVVTRIANTIHEYSEMAPRTYKSRRDSASSISELALWEHLIEYYVQAYQIALTHVENRTHRTLFDGGEPNEQITFLRQQLETTHPNWVRLMVERDLPERLHPLEILTKNLWWSWQMDAHALFEYIDAALWHKSDKNPITLLDRLSYKRFQELEQDSEFLARMDKVYADFNAYMAEKEHAKGPKIAYFSMEYGLHSSLKIYSGGLGILAGDYLKEASDQNVPMPAVGLLYRYGYFTQKLTAAGAQEAAYEEQNFQKLPISPVRDEEGNWKTIQIVFPGRTLTARIWRCDVGRTELYLLDTDHDMNLSEDRSITHHLYGGDWENRLKQELLLGIGGIRALRTLRKRPNVYHCNEGHAAFIGLERIRNLIDRYDLSFSEALEVVRSSSLFTTHTP
ncbi:MAG: alpha-glucan family phosphorylase, partial [Rikenellaceae bacterium]|nr:alpha-glucan family phosphorylase [Rikenellaceae bacterium]